MLRGLSQFLIFDTERFFAGKTFTVSFVEPWVDYGTQEVKGTKINVLIQEDNTEYRQTDGKPAVTNRHKNFDVKIAGKNIDIPLDMPVVLINPKATTYGEYKNELSVTADDIQPIQHQPRQQPQPQSAPRPTQRRA